MKESKVVFQDCGCRLVELIMLGMQERRSVLIAKVSQRLHVDQLGEKKRMGW